MAMAFRGNQASTFILTSGASGRIRALFSLRALKALLSFFNAVLLLLLFPFRKGTLLSSRFAWKSTAASTTTARRALAIRRVMEDADADADSPTHPTSLRDYRLIVSSRGDTIFTQSWIPHSHNNNIRLLFLLSFVNSLLTIFNSKFSFSIPTSSLCRGLVFLMHGLNEHRFLILILFSFPASYLPFISY